MRIQLTVVLQSQTQEMRNLFPIHATDKRIRSIDTRRNSTGRDNVAVFDPARSWHPVYVGAGRCSPRPGSLIRSCLAAVKNACAREDCGAGADGDDVFELWGSLLVTERDRQEMSKYVWVCGFDEVDLLSHVSTGPSSARDEEDIDCALVCRRRHVATTIFVLLVLLPISRVHFHTTVITHQIVRKCHSGQKFLTKASIRHGRCHRIHGLAEDCKLWHNGGVSVVHEE